MAPIRWFRHLHALTLEAAVLFLLIDAQTALQCVWCGTPPVPQPVLPMAFWRALFGRSEPVFLDVPLCHPIAGDLSVLVVFAGIVLAAHLFFLANGGLRPSDRS
jgi:hypothetical protein